MRAQIPITIFCPDHACRQTRCRKPHVLIIRMTVQGSPNMQPPSCLPQRRTPGTQGTAAHTNGVPKPCASSYAQAGVLAHNVGQEACWLPQGLLGQPARYACCIQTRLPATASRLPQKRSAAKVQPCHKRPKGHCERMITSGPQGVRCRASSLWKTYFCGNGAKKCVAAPPARTGEPR